MKIIIDDDWYIDSDSLCYILHDNTMHEQTRNGETKMVRSNKCNYYSKVEHALQSMCDKVRLQKTKDFEGTVEEYIEQIVIINKELERKISKATVVREEDKK